MKLMQFQVDDLIKSALAEDINYIAFERVVSSVFLCSAEFLFRAPSFVSAACVCERILPGRSGKVLLCKSL